MKERTCGKPRLFRCAPLTADWQRFGSSSRNRRDRTLKTTKLRSIAFGLFGPAANCWRRAEVAFTTHAMGRFGSGSGNEITASNHRAESCKFRPDFSPVASEIRPGNSASSCPLDSDAVLRARLPARIAVLPLPDLRGAFHPNALTQFRDRQCIRHFQVVAQFHGRTL